ncbi:MAG TPA: SRPBCC domain-containing protein [Streptosporangiaceae bacterium]|nr:SRPBCC domain-containing protein [Streptosporangiaceae bacterium]
MTGTTQADLAVQAYRRYIKAAPEAIWDALTRPGCAQQYGYQSPVWYDLRPGGTYRAFASHAMKARGGQGVVIEGEVVEAEPPRRLVQTWHALFDAETAAEAVTRLTWEIEDGEDGVAAVTLTHEFLGVPRAAALVADAVSEGRGGWSWILSDLKTRLETGQPLAA